MIAPARRFLESNLRAQQHGPVARIGRILPEIRSIHRRHGIPKVALIEGVD